MKAGSVEGWAAADAQDDDEGDVEGVDEVGEEEEEVDAREGPCRPYGR